MKQEHFTSRFPYIKPGNRLVFEDGYVAVPQTSVWFFIEDLVEAKQFAARNGMKFRPIFRGPRSSFREDKNGVMQYRTENNMKSWCLRADAKFFVINCLETK